MSFAGGMFHVKHGRETARDGCASGSRIHHTEKTKENDMELKVKIKLVREGGRVPSYQTEGAACCDLTAAVEEPLSIAPGERALVPTGIALDFGSPEWAALIFARSGLASKRGLTLANAVGVIDSDYRGEICVAMINLGSETAVVSPGERIAQLGFFPVARAVFALSEELAQTERGAGGFGHTGV